MKKQIKRHLTDAAAYCKQAKAACNYNDDAAFQAYLRGARVQLALAAEALNEAETAWKLHRSEQDLEP